MESVGYYRVNVGMEFRDSNTQSHSAKVSIINYILLLKKELECHFLYYNNPTDLASTPF